MTIAVRYQGSESPAAEATLEDEFNVRLASNARRVVHFPSLTNE